MATPKQLQIKENIKELRVLQRKSGELIGKRMAVLIELKKHELTGISKRDLSSITGINHNSITKWRKMYENGGIESLLKHGRVGFKKSILGKEEHNLIEKKLKDSSNPVRGYVELLDWVKTELKRDMKYITLVKYVNRHFGAKIKVARKSHVKKDEHAVEAFKKTSVQNAKM